MVANQSILGGQAEGKKGPNNWLIANSCHGLGFLNALSIRLL
jgi:hypothetical protein